MRKQGSSTIVKPKRAGKKSIASSMEFQAKFDRGIADMSAASAVTTSAGTNNFGVINERVSQVGSRPSRQVPLHKSEKRVFPVDHQTTRINSILENERPSLALVEPSNYYSTASNNFRHTGMSSTSNKFFTSFSQKHRLTEMDIMKMMAREQTVIE